MTDVTNKNEENKKSNNINAKARKFLNKLRKEICRSLLLVQLAIITLTFTEA